jgi:trimethylamine:corrinoid methyltransferase-like protein
MSQRILPIDTTRLRWQLLTPDDVQRIHQASLELIETAGIHFPSRSALDILHDHGAIVDRDKQIARIPGHLVETALSKAPPAYTLCARQDSELDLSLDGQHPYLAVDGTGIKDTPMQPKIELLNHELVERIIAEGFELLQDRGVQIHSHEAWTCWSQP